MVLLFEEPRREGDADISAVGDEFNDNCCNLESIISRLQQLSGIVLYEDTFCISIALW